jgi:hypothetical protein
MLPPQLHFYPEDGTGRSSETLATSSLDFMLSPYENQMSLSGANFLKFRALRKLMLKWALSCRSVVYRKIRKN